MKLVLRIHSGYHAGVAAALADGEYEIGSSDECDFILSDPGVQPHHLRLRVEGGSCWILVYDGADAAIDGVEIGADETPLAHFAVVSLGFPAFRVGPDNAEWPPAPEAAARPGIAAAPAETARPGAAVPVSSRSPAGRSGGAGPRFWLAAAAILLIAVCLGGWYLSSAAAVSRLRQATELLEGRGFSVAAEGSAPIPGALSLRLVDDRLAVTGAVDFSRHIGLIRNTLSENGFNPVLELVARDESLRQAEQWFRDHDIPMQVRMLGKTRAAVYGYAVDAAAAEEIMDAVRPLLAGFDSVNSEILAWPAMRRAMEEILARRGLIRIEMAPERFHIVATGVLSADGEIDAWREAEQEMSGRLRFQPRFEWRRPASEYLRLARRIFADRRIGLDLSLPNRETLLVSGYVRDAETGEAALRQLAAIMADWRGGRLASEFTTWNEAEPVLRRLLAANSLADAEVVEVGEFQVTLLADMAAQGRAETGERVLAELAAALPHAPAVVWRQPPPPEDAWFDEAVAALQSLGFQPHDAGDGTGTPHILNIAKGKGAIRVFGAVETGVERRKALEWADNLSFPVSVEVESREEVLERVRRLLADRGAMVAFERQPGNRLLLRGYVRDVDSGRSFLAELRPLLAAFAGVEEKFTIWAEVKTAFTELLDRAGLVGAVVEPGDHGVEVEGEAREVEGNPEWLAGLAALREKIGAEMPVAWKTPPPPSRARPTDVVRRLRAMGLEPVLTAESEQPRPYALSVRADGALIRVTGVVETTADKRRIEDLLDEGMLHLVVDVAVREEALRQAERFLVEMDIATRLTRIGVNRLVVSGYAADLSAGDALMREMREQLSAAFAMVDSDLAYWTEIRPPLAQLLRRHSLERLAVYPGEYEIVVAGRLEPGEEQPWGEILAAIEQDIGAPLPVQWSDTLPVIRRGRLERRRGLDSGSMSELKLAEMNIAAAALLPLDITGAIPAAEAAKEKRLEEERLRLEEEARRAAEEEARRIEEAARAEQRAREDWRMRLLEVVNHGGTRKIKMDGADRLYGEGELFQGYLIIDIFANGVMMMKNTDMVIYTVEGPGTAAGEE